MSAPHRVGGRLVEELISEDLDRATAPEAEDALSEHLEGCRDCRQLRDRYAEQQADLRARARADQLMHDREQIWSAVMARRAVATYGIPALLGRLAVAAVVLLAAVVLGVVVTERYRAAALVPARETVATVTVDLQGGGSAMLVIEQGSALARPGDQIGVGARVEIRLAAAATRGSAEIRFAAERAPAYGILGSAPELSGSSRFSFGGAFPRAPGADPVTYRIWLHLETDAGSIDSEPIIVQVTATRRGAEARAP